MKNLIPYEETPKGYRLDSKFNFNHVAPSILFEQEVEAFGHTVKHDGCAKEADAAQAKLCKSASKEQRAYEKQVAKDDKIATMEEQKEWNNKFDPNLDYSGEKLDPEAKQAFKEDYKKFLIDFPLFKDEKSKYSSIQRYAFLHKEMQYLKGKFKYWLKTKLNVLFNHKGPISDNDFYNYIQNPKIGGFEKFIELYKSGFPQTNLDPAYE